MFAGVRALFCPGGVHGARMQVWRRKLTERGGSVFSSPDADVSHVLAADLEHLCRWESSLGGRLKSLPALKFDWLEACLRQGQKLPEDPFLLRQAGTYPEEDPCAQTRTSSDGGVINRHGAPEGSGYSKRPSDGAQDPDKSAKRRRTTPAAREDKSPSALPTEYSTFSTRSNRPTDLPALHLLGGNASSAEDDASPGALNLDATGGATVPHSRAGEESLESGTAEAEAVLSEGERAWWWREIFLGAEWALPDREREALARKKSRGAYRSWEYFASRDTGGRDGAGGATSPPAPVEPPSVGQGLYCPPDVNKHLTAPLAELRRMVKEGLGEEFRALSYSKAVSVLEKVPVRISRVEQAEGLPALGESIIGKIKEILGTGRMERLESMRSSERDRTLALFGGVWAVGPKHALKLFNLGHRTLEDLRSEPSLSPAQRLSLRFHEDINTRIARADVAEMEELVRREAEGLCPGVSILCGGSYRRGRMTVGDLDFVATHPDGVSHVGFAERLVERLEAMGFITERLGTGFHFAQESLGSQDDKVDTFYGLCCKPGRTLRHRIDIKVFSRKQYAFGLLGWTGNDILNRRLRHLAYTRGFSLDDKGLKPKGGGGRASTKGGIECGSEDEIFEFFGCHCWDPQRRNL